MVDGVDVAEVSPVVRVRDVGVVWQGLVEAVVVHFTDVGYRVEAEPVDTEVQPEGHDVLRNPIFAVNLESRPHRPLDYMDIKSIHSACPPILWHLWTLYLF